MLHVKTGLLGAPLLVVSFWAHAQSACTRAPAIDSVITNLYASAWTSEGKRPLRDDEARVVIDGIRQNLRLPAPIPVVALDGAQPRSAAAIAATMMLRLATGHLASHMVVTSTGSDDLDSALTAAAARAEQAGAFGRIRARDPDTRIIVAFTTLAPVDAPEHGRSTPQPVAQAVLPEWAVERNAALAAWNAPIHYPSKTSWSTDGGVIHMPEYVIDTVDVQYIVDEAGAVVLPTVQVRSAHFAETLDSVENALPDLRYAPAQAGGCHAPQLVRQQFVFVGDDTARIDRRARPLPAMHIHGDSIVSAPAVMVTDNRCMLVPARDTLQIQMVWGVTFHPESYNFSAALQAVRLAGSAARPPDALTVCVADLRQDQRAPFDAPNNLRPGFVPVVRSARVIADIEVDSAGHAVEHSIHLVGASDPNAGRGMLRWLQGARYDPASIGGRPVRSWIRLNYSLDYAPPSWYN
jgi:hypothetical protein